MPISYTNAVEVVNKTIKRIQYFDLEEEDWGNILSSGMGLTKEILKVAGKKDVERSYHMADKGMTIASHVSC